MQQRYDDPLDVAVEVRPSFVLKADLFEKWRATGEEGRRKIDAALDRAVTEIIDKYQIAERTSAGNLRSWIGHVLNFTSTTKRARNRGCLRRKRANDGPGSKELWRRS